MRLLIFPLIYFLAGTLFGLSMGVAGHLALIAVAACLLLALGMHMRDHYKAVRLARSLRPHG